MKGGPQKQTANDLKKVSERVSLWSVHLARGPQRFFEDLTLKQSKDI